MEFIKMLHALAGLFIGVTGLLQIILPKGGSRHRTIGQIYFWCWPVLIATGAAIGGFLVTLFGILGLYMAFTGFRMGQKKRIRKKTIDKVAVLICIVLAATTLIYGTYYLINGSKFGIVGIVFGLIFLATTIADYLDFFLGKKIRRDSGDKRQWYFEHITRMYVSYIAALTAFTVIQKAFNSDLMNWLMPTVIGTLLIIISQRFFRNKMAVRNEKKKTGR